MRNLHENVASAVLGIVIVLGPSLPRRIEEGLQAVVEIVALPCFDKYQRM